MSRGIEKIGQPSSGGAAPAAQLLFSDGFGTDSRANYTYLAGLSTDITVSGGVLNTATGQHVMYPTALAAQADLQVVTALSNPAGVGHYNGVLVKAVGADTNNLIRAFYDVDTSLLDIDVVVAGTSVRRSSVALTLATGTPYWIAGAVHDNLVTAAIYDVDPNVNTTKAPIMALATALTPAEAAAVGAGINGHAGFWFNNNAAGATLDDLKIYTPAGKRFGGQWA